MPFDTDKEAHTSYFKSNCAFHALVHRVSAELMAQGPDSLPYAQELCRAVSGYYDIGIEPSNLKTIVTRLTHPVDRERFFGPVLRQYLAKLIESDPDVQAKVLVNFKARLANYFANPAVSLENREENLFKINEEVGRYIAALHAQCPVGRDGRITEVEASNFLGSLERGAEIKQRFESRGYNLYAQRIAGETELTADDVSYLYDKFGFNLESYDEQRIRAQQEAENPASVNGDFFPEKVSGRPTIKVHFLSHGHFDYEAGTEDEARQHNAYYDAESHEARGEHQLSDDSLREVKEQAQDILRSVVQARQAPRVAEPVLPQTSPRREPPTVVVRHRPEPTPSGRAPVETTPGSQSGVVPGSGRTPGGTGKTYGPENYVVSCQRIVPSEEERDRLKLEPTPIELKAWSQETPTENTVGYRFRLSVDYNNAVVFHYVKLATVNSRQYQKDDFVINDIGNPAKLVGAMRLMSESFTEVSLDPLKNDPDLLVRTWATARMFGMTPILKDVPVDRIDQLVDMSVNPDLGSIWQRATGQLSRLRDQVGEPLVSGQALQTARREFFAMPHAMPPTPAASRPRQG